MIGIIGGFLVKAAVDLLLPPINERKRYIEEPPDIEEDTVDDVVEENTVVAKSADAELVVVHAGVQASGSDESTVEIRETSCTFTRQTFVDHASKLREIIGDEKWKIVSDNLLSIMKMFDTKVPVAGEDFFRVFGSYVDVVEPIGNKDPILTKTYVEKLERYRNEVLKLGELYLLGRQRRKYKNKVHRIYQQCK